MLRIITYLLIPALVILALDSCKSNVKKDNPVPGSYPKIGDSKFAMKPIVNEIARYGRVDGMAIGIAGEMSDQYKRYMQLAAQASTDELVQLTSHSSPVVRVYAFWALASKDYSGLTTIYRKHLGDTAHVSTISGCMGMDERVSDMFKNCLQNKAYFVTTAPSRK